MKIIDAHVHIASYISGFTSKGELRALGCGKAQYSTGEIFQMFPPELGNLGITAESILKVMDVNGVDKAVLLQGNFLGFQNQYTYDAIQNYPDRFTGAATYDPFCLNVSAVRKRLFDDLKFKIVKFELSTGSGFMATRPDLRLDGKIINDCFKHASDYGLTVVLDIGRPGSASWQVGELAETVVKFPETTFVLCHLLAPSAGDGKILEDALKVLNLNNVYFDLSSLPHNQRESYPYPSAIKHLKIANQILGSKKLIFGTDMPLNLVHDSYEHLTDYIVKSGIFNENELYNIFSGNAEEVYFKI